MEAVTGGPEAAKIFSQTPASAFENRSRKILAVACELNDITVALNIYVIKGCHQLGTEPKRGCFSPVFIFLGVMFREGAGVSSYIRGIQGTSHLPCGRESLRPGHGWDPGWCTDSCFLEKLPAPMSGQPPDLDSPCCKWPFPESGAMTRFTESSSPSE